MSRLDHLLQKLAPGGVEFKLLGEISEMVRGNGMPKTDLTDQGIGAIHYGQIYTRYGVWTKTTISFVVPEVAAKLARVEPGNIIITNTSENVEDVGKAVAWLGDEAIVTGGHATVIRHNEDPKFLSYWFQSESFFSQKKALATGTKVIDVSARQLAKVRIPVPPIEVQREIAGTLDALAELGSELEVDLTKELRKRRQQYAYYADALLSGEANRSCPAGVPLKTLGAVGTFVRGGGFQKGDLTEQGVPAIHYGQIHTHYGTSATETISFLPQELAAKIRKAEPGNLVIVTTSEDDKAVGKAVAWLGTVDAAVSGDAYIYRHSLDPKYAAYLFQSGRFQHEKMRDITGTKVRRISGENLAKISVPVPPMEVQREIVRVLDLFQDLTAKLEDELETELSARRSQFSVYRDKLLAFDEGDS